MFTSTIIDFRREGDNFGWQDNQLEFTSHGSGNSDRRKEEKPSSLQKLKVWLNKIRDPV